MRRKTAKKETNRPAPPEELEAESLLEWQRVCDELDSAGRLNKADRALLTLYAQTWQTWHTAMQGVVKYGPVIKYPNKMTGPSPFQKVAKESAAQLRNLLSDLGLSPAARQGMTKRERDALPGDGELDF